MKKAQSQWRAPVNILPGIDRIPYGYRADIVVEQQVGKFAPRFSLTDKAVPDKHVSAQPRPQIKQEYRQERQPFFLKDFFKN